LAIKVALGRSREFFGSGKKRLCSAAYGAELFHRSIPRWQNIILFVSLAFYVYGK
jgi:hypothetical protein